MAHRNTLLAAAWIALFVSWASPGKAAPMLAGLEGGLDYPTSEMPEDGTLAVGIGYLGSQASYLFSSYPNRFYYVNAVPLPGLEVNARFTEVLGLHDPSIQLPNFVDRLMAVKWSHMLPAGWPRIALGLSDLFSINEQNGLIGYVPGSSRYDIAAFCLLGQDLGPVRLDMGYGTAKTRMSGGFMVAQWRMGHGLSALFEYGDQHVNWGLCYQPTANLSVKAGWMQAKELGLATAFRVSL